MPAGGIILILFGAVALLAIKIASDSACSNRGIAIYSNYPTSNGISLYKKNASCASGKQNGIFMVSGLAQKIGDPAVCGFAQYDLYFASILDHKKEISMHSDMVYEPMQTAAFVSRNVYDCHMYSGKYAVVRNDVPERVLRRNRMARETRLTADMLRSNDRINAFSIGDDCRRMPLMEQLPFAGNMLMLSRKINGSLEVLPC